MPGRPPKRDAERRRRNKPVVPTVSVDIAELVKQEVEIPAADPNWHPIAVDWYASLASSGQSVFYEPSDWMTAYILAETIDREMKPKEVRVGQVVDKDGATTYLFEEKVVTIAGAILAALLKGMTSLMVTEADRRRLSIELERNRGDIPLPEGVTDIVQAREGLLG